MAACVFNGSVVKALKNALKMGTGATIFTGAVNPSSAATTGAVGDVYISTSTGKIYQKQDGGLSTNWNPLGFTVGTLTGDRVVISDSNGNLTTDAGFTYNPTTDTLSVANLDTTGTLTYVNTTNLQVTDKLITLNKSGLAASAAASGIELEENAVITSYVKTSADRDSWEAKAPNTSGVATITPGAGGITLNQSSHNPVTLTTVGAGSPNANGITLTGQQLNLEPADATNPGVVTTASQTLAGDKTFTGSTVASGGVWMKDNVSYVYDAGDSTKRLAFDILGTTSTTTTIITNPTINREVTFPDATTTLLGHDNTATVSNKTLAVGSNNITSTVAKAAQFNSGTGNLEPSATSTTELGYVAGVTSAIQTQLDTKSIATTGDIAHTSATLADNTAAATNVTSFLFANASVRSFDALVSITRDATYEVIKITGIQKAASWEIAQTGTGDTTGVTLTITNAGQIQYTTTSTGSSATMKFRAMVTSV